MERLMRSQAGRPPLRAFLPAVDWIFEIAVNEAGSRSADGDTGDTAGLETGGMTGGTRKNRSIKANQGWDVLEKQGGL